MKDFQTGHAERQAAAAEAKKALLAKFKPKPTVTAKSFESREDLRAKELEVVRQVRAEAREAARLASAAKAELDLEAKRGQRRERKALTKSEQKAARDAKYAARKARQR